MATREGEPLASQMPLPAEQELRPPQDPSANAPRPKCHGAARSSHPALTLSRALTVLLTVGLHLTLTLAMHAAERPLRPKVPSAPSSPRVHHNSIPDLGIGVEALRQSCQSVPNRATRRGTSLTHRHKTTQSRHAPSVPLLDLFRVISCFSWFQLSSVVRSLPQWTNVWGSALSKGPTYLDSCGLYSHSLFPLFCFCSNPEI